MRFDRVVELEVVVAVLMIPLFSVFFLFGVDQCIDFILEIITPLAIILVPVVTRATR